MSIESSGSAARPVFTAAWWTPRLAGPVIAAAIVRMALLAVTLVRSGSGALLQGDAISYLEPGRNLLFDGRFFADGLPDLVRTPGYPLFLAITSLAGLPAAAVANVILSVFSVILVWRLGRTVFDDGRIALGAAWIFAFEPLSVVNSFILLSETLFLVLFLLSMERLAAFLRNHRLRVLAVAGLWLAAATLVRPVTYYLPVALALGLFLALVRVPGLPPLRQRPAAGGPGLPPQRQRPAAGGPGLRWKAPAVLLLSVLPWLAVWQLRNKLETGYGGITSVTEINAYFYIAADVTARAEHRNFISVRNELGYSCAPNCSEQIYLYPHYLAIHPEQAGWSQGQRLAFMHSEALRVIRAHEGAYLRSCFSHLLVVLFDPGTGAYTNLMHREDFNRISQIVAYKGPVRGEIELAKSYPWVAAEKAVFVVVLLGLYLLAARGAFRGGMHGACLGFLLGTSIYFFAVSAVAGGAAVGARYRLPVMPVVCILASAGVVRASKDAR